MVLSNPRLPDNPLQVVNAAFCSLTGYPEGEIIGRNCRFLAGAATDQAASEQIGAAIRNRQPVLTEILNYRRDGSEFRNGVMITPIYGPDAEVVWFLGSQVELGPAPVQALAQRRSNAAERAAGVPLRPRQAVQAMARGLLNKQAACEHKL